LPLLQEAVTFHLAQLIAELIEGVLPKIGGPLPHLPWVAAQRDIFIPH